MVACHCSADDFKQTLVPFNGPDPPFLLAHADGDAQTVTFSDQIAVSDAFRLSDGTSMCGQPMFKFTEIETLKEITKLRFKGLKLDEFSNELTLQPTNDDPIGLQKLMLTVYLYCIKDVFQTVEIAYFIKSAPKNSRKL
jgi:hypothetical protein